MGFLAKGADVNGFRKVLRVSTPTPHLLWFSICMGCVMKHIDGKNYAMAFPRLISGGTSITANDCTTNIGVLHHSTCAQ